ncbi:MAG: fatty acid desaturase [Deltaproteobacteria bacterium]|nr:fatty acid desaturase [Deltaproteobacteria bacterium]
MIEGAAAPHPTAARASVRELRPALERAGVFASSRGYHAAWLTAILALYAGAFAVMLAAPGWPLRIGAIAAGALAMAQLGLFAHEVGHGAVTPRRRPREALGQLTNSVLMGFGHSHWRTTHATHHNHPNRLGVDPDIDNAPGFALHEHGARTRPGVAARHQPALLFAAFLLWGFGIRVAAAAHAVRRFDRRTAVDLVGLALHLGLWFGVPLALGVGREVALDYVIMTVANGVYMAAILVPPHVGRGTSTAASELPWFERQVAMSRNFGTSRMSTLLSGGLNLQVEHHLLPWVPYTRLHRAQPIIEAYCRARHLPYHATSYWGAWREVTAHLRAMGTIARAAKAAPVATPTPRTS